MPTILITGFEPFNKSPVNPSQRVVSALAESSRTPGECELHTHILPVISSEAPRQLIELVERTQPDAVISLGEAPRRACITIEQVVLNLRDFSIPDESGQVIEDQAIIDDGPAAYFCTLPVRAMVSNLLAAGVPARISREAGAYLCNEITYCLLHAIDQRSWNTQTGFVHLPRLPEQLTDRGRVNEPSMALSAQVDAVERLIACVAGSLDSRQ